jgi:DNA polymerase-3 subunit alpha
VVSNILFWNFFNTIHFPPPLAAYPSYGNGVYLVLGRVVLIFGYLEMEVIKEGRLPLHYDHPSI